ncbi:hypothetical protein [Achromobacter spanius]|uniref:hypothetical protein n=1 Tax=Achromobacter spanius TaxID=217203 RepID=UPI0037F6359A
MSRIANLAFAARSFIVRQKQLAEAGPKGPQYARMIAFLDEQRATIEAEIRLAEECCTPPRRPTDPD